MKNIEWASDGCLMPSKQFFLTISCLEQVFIWDDEDCDVCFVQDQLSELILTVLAHLTKVHR